MPHAAFTADEHPWREPIHSTPGVFPSPSTNETPDADAGSPLTRSFSLLDREHVRGAVPAAVPREENARPECAPSLLSSALPREHETHTFILVEPPRRPGGRHGNSSPALAGRRLFRVTSGSGTFRPFAGGARRRCVPTSHVTAWAAGRRRVTQRLSSSFRGTVGCGDIRLPSVMTLIDRRALSSEQPREGLPAPRARGAIHRVTEPDFRLGWRGFDLSRGRGRRCSDRVPCPSAWGCLCYREDRSSERDVPASRLGW